MTSQVQSNDSGQLWATASCTVLVDRMWSVRPKSGFDAAFSQIGLAGYVASPDALAARRGGHKHDGNANALSGNSIAGCSEWEIKESKEHASL